MELPIKHIPQKQVAQSDSENNLHKPRSAIQLSPLPLDIAAGAELVKCIHDHVSTKPDEINLEEDDYICLITPKEPRNGYLYGKINGCQGWFPVNCVQSLTAQDIVWDSIVENQNEELTKTWYAKYKNLPKYQRKASATDAKAAKRAPGKRLLWAEIIGSDKIQSMKLGKNDIKRQEIILEIIATEQDYVDDLETICNYYMKGLQNSKLVRLKDISVLFSNIEQLLPVNVELLNSLEARQKSNPFIDMVGDIFIKMVHYFNLERLFENIYHVL